jgi:hypothetical protein
MGSTRRGGKRNLTTCSPGGGPGVRPPRAEAAGQVVCAGPGVGLERKNGWTLAGFAVDVTPDGM